MLRGACVGVSVVMCIGVVGVVVELPASAVFREVEVRQVALDEILEAATWAFDEGFAALHTAASVFLVCWFVAGNRRFAALWASDIVLVLGHGWFASESLRYSYCIKLSKGIFIFFSFLFWRCKQIPCQLVTF
jgi:hypothetical protein